MDEGVGRPPARELLRAEGKRGLLWNLMDTLEPSNQPPKFLPQHSASAAQPTMVVGNAQVTSFSSTPWRTMWVAPYNEQTSLNSYSELVSLITIMVLRR